MTDQNMPQPSAELRRINWGACFPFMTLFRTFRLAMQPSKLALALAAVLLTGVWGDVLDGLWRSKCQPPASEVNAFWQQADIHAWRESVKASWPMLIQEACEPIKVKLPGKLDDRLAANPDDAFDFVLERIREAYGTDLRIPVVYFTQLLGLALGFTAQELLLDQLVVDATAITKRGCEVTARTKAMACASAFTSAIAARTSARWSMWPPWRRRHEDPDPGVHDVPQGSEGKRVGMRAQALSIASVGQRRVKGWNDGTHS